MVYVTTRNELEDAIKRKEPEIIVGGQLAKKLKGFVKLKQLSKKEQAALLALVTGSGAAAAAAVTLAAPTGGLSVVGATAALMVAAPVAGVSMGAIIALIAVIGVIGLFAFALIKDYDLASDLDLGENQVKFSFKIKRSSADS